MQTVGELLEQLLMLPYDAVVVMSSDPEGNDFHSFGGFSIEDDLAVRPLFPLDEELPVHPRPVILWPAGPVDLLDHEFESEE